MGVVYRAFDTELGHDVALKSLPKLQPDDVYYLKSEFRSLADVRHPNLVDLYELFASDEGCCFTMELVSGAHFTTHVRIGGSESRCDYERLRDAAKQLTTALLALHSAGKLHRDVKPSNVMVTSDGRVVLLDFGLVAPLSGDAATTATGTLVGTIEYMAPEQARGQALSTAADWYSFGATLFEAMTGQVAVDKPLAWLLGHERGAKGPPRVRDLAPDAPQDLDDLVAALLSPEAARRPGGNDVLARLLGDSVPSFAPPSAPAPTARADPFEGRTSELDQLARLLEVTACRSLAVVHVHGPSGMGKTELLRKFTQTAQTGGAWVLRGRCHPQESVAFNALDGVIDDLTRLLERLPRSDLDELLPPTPEALPRLFPVLGRIEPISQLLDLGALDSSQEARRHGTVALKELLHRLATKHPLVVWLDDLQWGDEDSGRLLRELLAPPAPPLLLLLAFRADDSDERRTPAMLRDDGRPLPPVTLELPLTPLSAEETRALLGRLLSPGEVSPRTLDELVAEVDGIPFLAHELAHSPEVARSDDVPPRGALSLDERLQARLTRLDADERRMLEVVSVAGGPLEQRLLLRAAGVHDRGRTALAFLERSALIRTATLSASRLTEIYHHRLRDAVMSRMPAATCGAHHRALAQAMLGAAQPNLAQIVDHFVSAGDGDSARRYVVPAARQAAAALAFDRAAGLYRKALELGSTEASAADLHEMLGEALADGGRGRDAGRAFERAAELAEDAGATSDFLLSLRRRAATQYLKSLQRDDSRRALTRVLKPLGISTPETPSAALREAISNRLRVAFASPTLGPGGERTAPGSTSDRLEMLQFLTLVYGMTEPAYGMAFGSRLLREALESRDPRLVMRGLACELVSLAAIRNSLTRRQAERHLSDFERLCASYGGEYETCVLHMCRAEKLWFQGRFDLAAVDFQAALRKRTGLPAGFTVEAAGALSFYLTTLGYLGQVALQATKLDEVLRDAQARGDDYLVAVCGAGHSSLGWLVTGRELEALTWAERVRSQAPSDFSSQHVLHLITTVQAHLLAGRTAAARAAMVQTWPAIRKNHYLSLAMFGDDLIQLRARTALAFAASTANRPSAAKPALSLVSRDARRIEAHGLPFASAWADLLRAGVACLEGNTRRAEQRLERAVPALEGSGLLLYAAAARYALGHLRRGAPSGVATEGEAWMHAGGVLDPAATARMLVPGCVRPT
jgi:eukaryotic-like serine/threonine-protein kinase